MKAAGEVQLKAQTLNEFIDAAKARLATKPQPLPEAGELLAVPEGRSPEAQRTGITRLLESLEVEDELGKIRRREDIPEGEFNELARTAARTLGIDWGKALDMDQAGLIKALRARLGEIEKAKKEGKPIPPAPEAPPEAANATQARLAWLYKDWDEGESTATARELLDRVEDIIDTAPDAEVPQGLRDAAQKYREAIEEDYAMHGRGDVDPAEEAFMKELANMKAGPAKPTPPPPVKPGAAPPALPTDKTGTDALGIPIKLGDTVRVDTDGSGRKIVVGKVTRIDNEYDSITVEHGEPDTRRTIVISSSFIRKATPEGEIDYEAERAHRAAKPTPPAPAVKPAVVTSAEAPVTGEHPMDQLLVGMGLKHPFKGTVEGKEWTGPKMTRQQFADLVMKADKAGWTTAGLAGEGKGWVKPIFKPKLSEAESTIQNLKFRIGRLELAKEMDPSQTAAVDAKLADLKKNLAALEAKSPALPEGEADTSGATAGDIDRLARMYGMTIDNWKTQPSYERARQFAWYQSIRPDIERLEKAIDAKDFSAVKAIFDTDIGEGKPIRALFKALTGFKFPEEWKSSFGGETVLGKSFKNIGADSPEIRRLREVIAANTGEQETLRDQLRQIKKEIADFTAQGHAKEKQAAIAKHDETVARINVLVENLADAKNKLVDAVVSAPPEAAVVPPEPLGFPAKEVTGKDIKAQRENLLSQVTAALKKAPEKGEATVTFSVPGDGEFTVTNTKERLTQFKRIVTERTTPTKALGPMGPFPKGVPAKQRPRTGSRPIAPPTKMPEVAPPAPGETPAVAGPFMSTDPTRFVLNTGYADGTQIIATDGRGMIRIVTPDAPGSVDKPVGIGPKGEQVPIKGNFPNYNQIWSEKPDLVKGGAKTDELWQVANGALALFGSDEKAPRSVNLFVNPDGSIGGKAEYVGVGSYEHNVQPGAKGLGKYNPEYLLRSAEAARKLGDAKVDLYFHGEDGPLEFRGSSHASLLMGMGEGGKMIGRDKGFSPGAAVHGTLPLGLGPMKNPDALLQSGTGITKNGEYLVSLEGGKFKIEKRIPAGSEWHGSPERWETVAEGLELEKLSKARDTGRRDLIANFIKAEKASGETIGKIDKAMGEVARQRQEIIEEGQRRASMQKGGTVHDALDKAAQDALDRIKKRRGGITFGLGPGGELPNIKDYAIYGAARLAKYGLKGAEWTADMIKTFGEKIRPHLAAIYEAAKDYLERYKQDFAKAVKPTDVQKIIEGAQGIKAEPPNSISEAIDTLQSSLRTARALKQHFAGQPKVSKAEVKAADDWLEGDANRIREGLTDLVKRELPLSERGKFITAINNATKRVPILSGDPEAMYRHAATVAARVLDRSNEVRKANAISGLKETVKRALESPGVDIGYKHRILDLLSRISFTKPMPDTIRALQATRDYIARMEAAGEDPKIPKEILDNLELLTQIPIREMPAEAVFALAQKIAQLEELGRLKVTLREHAWEIEKNSKIRDLADEDTTPIEKRPQFRPQPGDPRSLTMKLGNWINKTLDSAGNVDRSLLPLDAVFDMLGDAKGEYRGWLFRHVRGPLDLGFNAASVLRDRMMEPIVRLVKKNKMGEQQAERIGVYAIAAQEGGMERLVEMGVDPRKIESIIGSFTDQERAVYLEMRKAMDSLLPDLQKLMHELYNIDVKPVENYFPMPRDWEVMRREPAPIKEPTFGEPMTYDELAGWKDLLGDFMPGRTTKERRGFTIERKPGAMTPIQLNAFDVFYQHINDVSYLLKTQRDLKMIGEMARGDLFVQKYGGIGQNIVLDFLDTFARQGRLSGLRRITWIDELRKRTSAGIVGLRIASQFVHASNIGFALERAGADNYRAALMELASGRASKFMADNFAEAFARGGGEPAMVEAAAQDVSVFGKTLVPKKLVRAGFAIARAIDRVNAEATMLGVYFSELKRKGVDPARYLDMPVDPEAQSRAMVLARRAVASPLPKDVPQALSRGALTGGNISIGRALFQFQNIFLDQWSNIRHDLWRAGIREINPERAFRMFMAIAVTIAAETAIRTGVKQAISTATGYEPKKEESIPEKALVELVRRFPLGGQITSALMFKQSGLPMFDAIYGTGQAAKTLLTTEKPRTAQRAGIRVLSGVGQIMGVPGAGQAGDIAEQLVPRE